jgi:hypothetical protein
MTVQNYVFVYGALDMLYVGPFADEASAQAYAERGRAGNATRSGAGASFEFHLITEAAMRENIAEYGELPIRTPEEMQEMDED